MTNLRWLKWAIARHFRRKGLKTRFASIRVGNAAIDGEVIGRGWKMALEIKTPNDDIVRGLGQLAEALAHGYDSAILVTTIRKTKRIKSPSFNMLGLVLLGVDSKGDVKQVYPAHCPICPEIPTQVICGNHNYIKLPQKTSLKELSLRTCVDGVRCNN